MHPPERHRRPSDAPTPGSVGASGCTRQPSGPQRDDWSDRMRSHDVRTYVCMQLSSRLASCHGPEHPRSAHAVGRGRCAITRSPGHVDHAGRGRGGSGCARSPRGAVGGASGVAVTHVRTRSCPQGSRQCRHGIAVIAAPPGGRLRIGGCSPRRVARRRRHLSGTPRPLRHNSIVAAPVGPPPVRRHLRDRPVGGHAHTRPVRTAHPACGRCSSP